MFHALHLGPPGEEAWVDLLAAFELGSGFQACTVAATHGKALAEVGRRLEAAAPALHRIEPGTDLVEQVRSVAPELASTEGRSVLWLEQTRFDAEAWRAALTTLNQHRQWISSEAPTFLVLAGPIELIELIQTRAPDFWSICSFNREFTEAPRLAPAAATVRWLHLSDLHFEATERWDRRVILRALLHDVVEPLAAGGLAPDLVMVTGDIAHSGQRTEYDQAERFFSALAGKLELEPRDRWFLVPGNHDVDRSAIGPVDGFILAGLADQDEIAKVFAHAPTMQLLGKRLEQFYAFTERFLGPAKSWRGERPWRVDVPEINGVPVGVLQLNSAWAGGTRSDRGHLLVGEVQVREALELSEGGLFRIAMMHHPTANLRENDGDRLETLLGSPGGAAFLLRGHLHRTMALTKRSPDGMLTELAAGATYVKGQHPKTCNLVEVDLGSGQARVHLYRFNAEGRGVWQRDTSSYETLKDGIWSFELPPGLNLGEQTESDGQNEPSRISESRRRGLVARYREAAAAVFGTARFIGLADHRPRPNVRVPELFVPLRLKVRTAAGATSDEASWTTAKLANALLAKGGRGETATRIVVLGDPGSGKTTLCRFLTVLVAGEAELAEVDVRATPVPLFLPFREYVREIQDEPALSLLDFLTRQARNHLSVPVSDDFLETILEAGAAVLLLDGLDEVRRPEERATMRDRVLGFCRAYRTVPVLVTSRVAGYDDAQLPCDGDHGFAHLEAAPFSNEDLHEFATRWYALQEPDDTQARDRGTADLIAAIEAEPRVQELARNPMLATLIALIHRFEALPGERAKLYDLCVKTLLETWPAAKRLPFREIDSGLQRVYLEQLAFRLQESRGNEDREVVISRKELVSALVEILRQRQHQAEEPEQTQALVERWVAHLAEGTGLLVEQRTGVFAFFHLSLMEYLAARGMDRSYGPTFAFEVVKRCDEPAWQEVCLLAVGSKAEDGSFLDDLYRAVERSKEGKWIFLLRCMREEADFRAWQREKILAAVRELGLGVTEAEVYAIGHALDNVLKFSIRNGKSARNWVTHELRTACGQALLVVAELRRFVLDDKEMAALREREDNSLTALSSLLHLWPVNPIAKWAVATLEPSEIVQWAISEPPHDLLTLRGAAALSRKDSPAMTAALSAALGQRALFVGSEVVSELKALSSQERPGGKGIPPALKVGCGVLGTFSNLPCWNKKKTGEDQRSVSAERILIDRSDAVFQSLAEGKDTLYFGTKWYISRQSDGIIYFSYSGRDTFPSMKAPDCDLAAFFHRDYVMRVASNFSSMRIGWWNLTKGVCEEWLHAVTQQEASGDVLSGPPTMLALGQAGDEVDFGKERLRIMAAEFLLGLATTVRLPKTRRQVHVLFRGHNRWILQIWEAVEERLPVDPIPAQLALYLALGWTQQTTTWEWPGTERWVALLSGDPPEHWLPRLHWHLCWQCHDRDDPTHRAEVETALRQGLKDTEHPGVAKIMQESLGLTTES